MAELETENSTDLREQQQAVGAVLRAVASGEGLQPVLDEVVEAATRLSHGERGILCLTDGELLRVVADYGMADLDPRQDRCPDRTTAIGRVGSHGRSGADPRRARRP